MVWRLVISYKKWRPSLQVVLLTPSTGRQRKQEEKNNHKPSYETWENYLNLYSSQWNEAPGDEEAAGLFSCFVADSLAISALGSEAQVPTGSKWSGRC